MSQLTSLACSCLLAASVLTGQATAAQLPAPRRARTRPSPRPAPADADCIDTTRLVSHVAYLPVGPAQTTACGHLLSTDTVLAVHHWAKT